MLGKKMGRLPSVFEEDRPSAVFMPANKFEGTQRTIAAGHQPYFASIDAEGRLSMFGVGKMQMFGRPPTKRGDEYFDGDDDEPLYTQPASLPEPHDKIRFSRIACGANHVVGCTKSGHVYAWGSNGSGQLGRGARSRQDDPRRHCMPRIILSLQRNRRRIVELACGASHTSARDAMGRVYTWGRGKCGRLGHGIVDDVHAPRELTIACDCGRVAETPKIVGIAAGWSHSVVVAACGIAYAFGCGKEGRLGLNSYSDVLVPRAIIAFRRVSPTMESPVDIVAVSAGYAHTLFLSSEGNVFACGHNMYGQLGLRPHGFEESEASTSQLGCDGSEDADANGELMRIRMQGGAVSPPMPLIRAPGALPPLTPRINVQATPRSKRSVTADATGAKGRPPRFGTGSRRRKSADAVIRGLSSSALGVAAIDMTPKRGTLKNSADGVPFVDEDGDEGAFSPSWEPGYVCLEPCTVPFFKLTAVKPKTLACGENHSACILEDGRIVLWGLNSNGQCGVRGGGSRKVAPPVIFDVFGAMPEIKKKGGATTPRVSATVCTSSHTMLLI